MSHYECSQCGTKLIPEVHEPKDERWLCDKCQEWADKEDALLGDGMSPEDVHRATAVIATLKEFTSLRE